MHTNNEILKTSGTSRIYKTKYHNGGRLLTFEKR